MFFLTALAMAAAQAPQTAKSVDCRPMLTLMAYDRDTDSAREPAQRRNDPRPRPQRRCITLASA